MTRATLPVFLYHLRTRFQASSSGRIRPVHLSAASTLSDFSSMNFNHNRVLLSVKPHSLTRIPFAMLFFFYVCRLAHPVQSPTNRHFLSRAVLKISTSYPTGDCRTCASTRV